MSADTAIMPIPGPIDPVPVPRAATPRADGKVELVGLPRDKIRTAFEDAGLDQKQSKLRGKQVWHWIYNRGVGDFDAMSDIAKAQRPWFAERFAITRPEVVEAQVSTDGTRKWLLKTHDGHDFEMVFIPDADPERFACRARSAARSTAASATPAPCSWFEISSRRKSSARLCSPATHSASGRASPRAACSPTS